MGIIRTVPVISEEFERLTQEDKDNPHKLFKAINDPNNAKGSYFFKMKAFFDNEKKQNEKLKQKNIDFGFQAKQIKEIDTPFGRFPVPNIKNLTINKVEQEKFKSFPPMNTNYRPQRKQYSPKEVKQYMTSTIDLSQPDFTYCSIKDIEKHSEYAKMIRAYEADKNFSEKYSKAVRDGQRRLSQVGSGSQTVKSRQGRDVLLRNSMYILPHLKETGVSKFPFNPLV